MKIWSRNSYACMFIAGCLISLAIEKCAVFLILLTGRTGSVEK